MRHQNNSSSLDGIDDSKAVEKRLLEVSAKDVSTQRCVFYCKECDFKYTIRSCLTNNSIVVHDRIVLEWEG